MHGRHSGACRTVEPEDARAEDHSPFASSRASESGVMASPLLPRSRFASSSRRGPVPASSNSSKTSSIAVLAERGAAARLRRRDAEPPPAPASPIRSGRDRVRSAWARAVNELHHTADGSCGEWEAHGPRRRSDQATPAPGCPPDPAHDQLGPVGGAGASRTKRRESEVLAYLRGARCSPDRMTVVAKAVLTLERQRSKPSVI
jgi:hypothetical protein